LPQEYKKTNLIRGHKLISYGNICGNMRFVEMLNLSRWCMETLWKHRP